MTAIINKFEDEAKKRGVVLEKSTDVKKVKTYGGKEIDLKQVLFRTTMRLGDKGLVPASILFQDDKDKTRINYQITYNSVAQISDRSKHFEILQKLNELNLSKTGYYHFLVHSDGRISLRNVGLTTIDVEAMLETFLFAGKLIGMLLSDLENIEGIQPLPVTE